MSESENRYIGGFRILGEIKTNGSQGRIYRAVCETDDLAWCPRGKEVALKTMPISGEDEAALEKLRRHTETLVAINHPNIVKYYGCFTDQSAYSEMHVIVQEFLHGQSLKDRLATHPTGLDADEALKVVGGMVAGLAAATEKGIIHRDVKPANIILCDDGAVKLIDFEVARQTGNTATISGNMIGSFDYMAPDFTDPHFSGDEVSDIFSAGVIMHEVLSGKMPYRRFSGQSQQASFAFLERWSRDDSGKFIKGSCTIASSIERVVAHARPVLSKALSLRRDGRFRSFAEFKTALADVKMRDLQNGKINYRILQLVGKGGFGEVFKARSNGRTYAVKHLLTPQYASRFYREAKIMSELEDSSFVRFFDFFVLEHSGIKEAFLVMDFLPGMPGSSLRDAIRKSAGSGLDFDSVLKAFIRYAHGLKMIHSKGIYHRDIKPTNLYYPEDRPDSSSIMDLGIARDASGTETTGQVPGTLDYMPPETALGSTRGDAGMDIYALGLCLYEALSGKKGFPKLPSGSQGYAQFFRRAKEKARPNFDDPRVTSHPELHALLVKMTEPDLANRLVDADRLEQELNRILAGGGDFDDAATAEDATAVPPGQAAQVSCEGTEDDEATGETAFVPQQAMPDAAVKVINAGLRKMSGKGKPHTAKTLLAWVTTGIFCGILGAGLVLFRTEIDTLVSKFLRDSRMNGGGGYADASSVFDGTDMDIPDVYGDDSISIDQADALRERWLAERKPLVPDHEFLRAVNTLDQKREQRIIRERLETERSKFDADVKETVRTYVEEGVAAGDDKRKACLATWTDTAQSKIDAAIRLFDKARRERLDFDAAKSLLPRATLAADKIVKSYEENGLKIADREIGVWKQDWEKRLLKSDFDSLHKRMADARDRAVGKIEKEKRDNAKKALYDECGALLEMVTPVQSRDARLYEAEMKIRQGASNNLIDEDECKKFLEKIAEYKKWTVFEVVNHSDLDLHVGDVTIENTCSHIFVYTNTPPGKLAVECFGYESLPLGRQTNGKVITLLPEHFAMLKVDVFVGELEEGVVCRIDGVSVRDKVIKMIPGTHECVYQKKDYKNQTIPFRVEPGVSMTLPLPGKWLRSEEWQQLERERKRKEKAKSIEKSCRTLMDVEPISNRVARLSTCGKILRNWSVPDTLGEQKHKELSTALADAMKRSYGAVLNDTAIPLRAIIQGADMEFLPKSRVVVEYPSDSSLDAQLTAHGYEPIPIPDGFCGMDFHVNPSMMRPLPVKLSILEKPDDVVCSIDGAEFPGDSVMALPGNHIIAFMRTDYIPIEENCTIQVGEPLSVHCPVKWKPSEVMLNLIAAEAAAESGDWERVKTLLAASKVRGDDARNRKMALNLRYEQRRQFMEMLDAAAIAYQEERWHEVIKRHFELKLKGYTMTSEDRNRVAVAIEKRASNLDMLKKIAATGDFGASDEKIDAEIKNFKAMAGLLTQEIEAAKKGGKQ